MMQWASEPQSDPNRSHFDAHAPHMESHPVPSGESPPSSDIPSGHTDAIHDTQFDYYGELLATASSDRTVGIHVVRPNMPIQRVATLSAHTGPVWMLSWAHPRFGNVLASAGYDKRAVVWREDAPQSLTWSPVHVVDIHQGSVNAVHWAPEEYGLTLATASSDGTVAVTVYNDGHWHESVKVSNNTNRIAHAMGANCVAFAPFKNMIAGKILMASGGCDNCVRLWVSDRDGGDGQLQPFQFLQSLNTHTDWVRDVSFCTVSVASRYALLASCGQDKTVTLYRKPWDQLAMEMQQSPGSPSAGASPWEQSTVKLNEAVWRLSWAPSAEILIATTADAEAHVLRCGAEFTDPWIVAPVSDNFSSSNTY